MKRRILIFAVLLASAVTCAFAQTTVKWAQPIAPVERITNSNFATIGTIEGDAANWRPYPDVAGNRGYTRKVGASGQSFAEIVATKDRPTVGLYQRIDLNETTPLAMPLNFKATVSADVITDSGTEPSEVLRGLQLYVELHHKNGKPTTYLVRKPFYVPFSMEPTEIAVTVPGETLHDNVDYAFVVVAIFRGVGTARIHSVSCTQWPRLDSAAVFAFDDGIATQWAAYQKLHAAGKPAMFFPYIANVGQAGGLTWDQLRLAISQGSGIGSHTVSHLDAEKLFNKTATAEELADWKASALEVAAKYKLTPPDFSDAVAWFEWEIKTSNDVLVAETCQPIFHYASPFGASTGYSEVLTECEYDTQRHFNTGMNASGMHPKVIYVERLDRSLLGATYADTYHNVDQICMWAAQDKSLIIWVAHSIVDDPADPYSCPQWLFDLAFERTQSWNIPIVSYDEGVAAFGDREKMFPEFQQPRAMYFGRGGMGGRDMGGRRIN